MSYKTPGILFALTVALTVGCQPDSSSSERDDGGEKVRSDGGGTTDDVDRATDATSTTDAPRSSETGEQCEDYPPVEPTERMVAGRWASAPEVDGVLDEPVWNELPELHFSDPDSESDNEVTVQAGWSDDRLFFALQVSDEQIEYVPDEPISSNDSAELFFDTEHDRDAEMTEDDHQWLVPVEGEPRTKRGSETDEQPDTDIALESAVVQHDASYVVELSAPLADLGVDPAEGDEIGFLVANNDLDSGDRVPYSWRDILPFKQPVEWGTLLFADTTCSPAADVGPGGSDTDADEGDTDAGPTECPEQADYEPTPVSGPESIGGGPTYSDKVCQSDADEVVSTRSELEDALGQASSGDVIFVDPDAELDMGFDARLEVPSGVTLSGGRGCDCRAGALLYTDEIVKEDYDHEKILVARGDARVTGLRIRGPRNDREWITQGEQDHYLDGGGVDAAGSDVEIDNNEIWGFAHQGIGGGASTHVHHNYLHTMPRDGLGYGISGGDELLIEYNYFEFVRHAVASGGRSSYTARYNHMGKYAISHVFDMHKEGGGTIKIHHNTVEAVDNQLKSKNVPAVTIRGAPSDTADIHNNWFYNPKEPLEQPTNNWTDEAIVQMHVTEWTNVSFWDNHYGSSGPNDCDVGAPRDGC